MAETVDIGRDTSAAKESFGRLVWKRLRRDRYAMTGLVIIATLFVLSYLSPVIANDKPIVMQWNDKLYYPAIAEMAPFSWWISYPELFSFDFKTIRNDKSIALVMPPIPYGPHSTSLDDRFLPPSAHHLLGTDQLGRDVAAMMLHGASISLKVGFVAVGISLIIGLITGAIAGFYGGIADTILSRLIEIMICFPFLFLILAVIAFLPPNIYNIMIVIGVTRWTDIARYTRGEFMRLKEREFTDAARALGASDRKIILRHILPNSLAPVLVTATFGVASAILIEAALSFLGMGVQPPMVSWGGILASGQVAIEYAWWLATFPGIAIFITVTAYNVVGEGLRDASDPRITMGESH